ncbi:MAG: DinB family protein [Calditrichaeota bacterium]|nr:MAG: DinB family protein [Calditrichota bacterium]
MNRPEKNEYAEYYETYVSLVPAGDICTILTEQLNTSLKFLAEIDEHKANFRYAKGKWSVKEVVGHIVDCERVFAYRALWFARNDPQPLPSMDQDDFMTFSNFADRQLKDICAEFSHVRQSNIILLNSFNDEISRRKGKASGTEMSVRAIAYILAGHERHHLNIIKERYI